MEKFINNLLFYRNTLRFEVIIIAGIALGGICLWVYWRCILYFDTSFRQLLEDVKKRDREMENGPQDEPIVKFTKEGSEGDSSLSSNGEGKVEIIIRKGRKETH